MDQHSPPVLSVDATASSCCWTAWASARKTAPRGTRRLKGKVERFHRTLKKALAVLPPPADVKALDVQLAQVIHRYNHHRPHRALGRATPASEYLGQPKATVVDPRPSRHDRIRVDRVHTGKITLRYEGVLRKLYVGRAWEGIAVSAVCVGPEVTVIEKDTGRVLADFVINPDKVYQRKISGPPT